VIIERKQFSPYLKNRYPVPQSILITGVPGVGKTTFILRLSVALEEQHPCGFITREIREAGCRVGFEIIGFDGTRRPLSHVDLTSRYRVGKYGVDIEGFEEYLATLDLEGEEKNPVIIDEIGKMECYSPIFRDMVAGLLESDRLFIATIAKKGTPFIESIKERKDVHLFEITRENRDLLREPVLRTIRSLSE
jgi:nucleoside-triphosphatase